MRILFVSPRQALPTNSGAKLRDFHLARSLAARNELTYVHYFDPGEPPSWDGLGAQAVISIPRPRGYTAAKLIRGVFGRWPLSVENYTSPQMHAELSRIASARQFNLVHLDAIQLAAHEPVFASLGLRTVYDWHNIESELMERFADNIGSLAKRLYARYTARRLRGLEAAILRSALGHIVCSERERDQLLALAPKARVAVIPNGVDTSAFASTQGPEQPDRLIFVGSMNYHANIDAASQFVNGVWPRLRARFPNLRFTIVGANPVPAVQALQSVDGVEVTGTVPDIRPYYAQAIASLVPLTVGGGTRLKILEAMAAGVPVISSPIGAEGLAVNPGSDILIASDPAGWESSIASLLDSETSRKLAAAGRDLAEKHYDWNMIGARLHDLYARWLGGQA